MRVESRCAFPLFSPTSSRRSRSLSLSFLSRSPAQSELSDEARRGVTLFLSEADEGKQEASAGDGDGQRSAAAAERTDMPDFPEFVGFALEAVRARSQAGRLRTLHGACC